MQQKSSVRILSRQDHFERHMRLGKGASLAEPARSKPEAQDPPVKAEDPTKEWVKRQLELHPKIVMPSERNGVITRKKVLRMVADEWDTTPEDIVKKNKERVPTIIRCVTAYLMHEVLGKNFVEIGHVLQRDYSTLMHGIRLLDKYKQDDPELAPRIERLEKKLRCALSEH